MLFYCLCLIALVVGMTSGKDSGGDEESNEEQNFSISIEDLDGVQIEVIPGNKKNSKRLVLDNTFICTQKDKSVDGATLYCISASRDRLSPACQCSHLKEKIFNKSFKICNRMVNLIKYNNL